MGRVSSSTVDYDPGQKYYIYLKWSLGRIIFQFGIVTHSNCQNSGSKWRTYFSRDGKLLPLQILAIYLKLKSILGSFLEYPNRNWISILPYNDDVIYLHQREQCQQDTVSKVTVSKKLFPHPYMTISMPYKVIFAKNCEKVIHDVESEQGVDPEDS